MRARRSLTYSRPRSASICSTPSGSDSARRRKSLSRLPRSSCAFISSEMSVSSASTVAFSPSLSAGRKLCSVSIQSQLPSAQRCRERTRCEPFFASRSSHATMARSWSSGCKNSVERLPAIWPGAQPSMRLARSSMSRMTACSDLRMVAVRGRTEVASAPARSSAKRACAVVVSAGLSEAIHTPKRCRMSIIVRVSRRSGSWRARTSANAMPATSALSQAVTTFIASAGASTSMMVARSRGGAMTCDSPTPISAGSAMRKPSSESAVNRA